MNVNEEWSVSVSIAETDGQTRAEALLVMPGGEQLAGHGQARRNPADPEVARIGAQLAAARALSDLAGQLVHAAATAIDSPGGPAGRPPGSDGPAAGEQEEEIVVTPGGPRPRRLVTAVGPGQAVHFTDRGGQVVTAGGQSSQNPPDEPCSRQEGTGTGRR